MRKKPRDYIYAITVKGRHYGNAPTKEFAEHEQKKLAKLWDNIARDDIKISKQYKPAIKRFV